LTEPSRAVFLSYASQDAAPAARICAALRAAGVEVWFDQAELRGGDIWDQKIRREIRDCGLFIPLISANTAARREGYFRLEWNLADQRTQMMARNQLFVVPVCLDSTPDAGADVPESFHRVQWTRLRDGETPPEFVARVVQLLTGDAEQATSGASTDGPTIARPLSPRAARKPMIPMLIGALGAVIIAYLLIDKLWIRKRVPVSAAPLSAAPTASPARAANGGFTPPAHSIAVLPFVNMSNDKEQDYFSDGLTEEVLNSLARINELQVAARTSAFSFKGKDLKIATIARELNVGAILEGSVRRSGHTVRISAQLINAVTGFHLWSQTYDRDLGDILKLQSEIANSVASALKVTLLGDTTQKIELGGTHNSAAFDAYLRGMKSYRQQHSREAVEAAIGAFTEAIRSDSGYALAFAGRSLAFELDANFYASDKAAVSRERDNALADAQRAISLAPDLPEGHIALARHLESSELDFAPAQREFERARALAPGSARVLSSYGNFAVLMGQTEAGLAAVRRALVLDPLNADIRRSLASSLFFARRYQEALSAGQHALALDPDNAITHALLGFSYFALGDFQSAKTACEIQPRNVFVQVCLAVTYDKLGRSADSLAVLKSLQAESGDTAAYQFAQIHANRGEFPAALQWLEKAQKLRDTGLTELKTDALMDPLRKEPRFQAIERELRFPS
jgi:TolB-like protein/Flp pilus assembly protein TadD